jgi:hypothetical protein
MMQYKKTLLALMLMGAAAAQADYQAQIDFDYRRDEQEYDPDAGPDTEVDNDIVSLSGTIFLSPVSTANGPLDEAAFLSKASGISLGYSTEDVEAKHGDGYDSDSLVISGHFVVPGTNLILEAAYGQGESGDADVDTWGLGFGAYINDRTMLMLEYSKQDYDFGSDDTDERVRIRYRQLIDLSNGQNLAIEPYIGKVEFFSQDGVELGIKATYYINRSLGIKVGLHHNEVDDDTAELTEFLFTVGCDYYINENFRIGGEVHSVTGTSESDFGGDTDIEGSGIEVSASLRF